MKQPVRDIELIKIFANAVVVWLVVMGFWPLTDAQQAITLTMVMAGIQLAGSWLQNRETTPLSKPVDVDGTPLSRPGDVPAIKQLAALQTEALEINASVPPATNPPKPRVAPDGLR